MTTKNSLERKKRKKQTVELDDFALKQLWLFGDWQEIINATQHLDFGTDFQVEHVYRLTALLQTGDVTPSCKKLTLASEQQNLFAKLLVSGVYNSLAKAAACNLDNDKAKQLIGESIKVASPATAISSSVVKVRYAEQMAQLGLPTVWKADCQAKFTADISLLLTELSHKFPKDETLCIALAENAHKHRRFDEAIRYWQQVSAVLGIEMPQQYYDRLKCAYQSSGSFPLGKPEQEQLRGEGDKHQILAQIHKIIRPLFYLEIGVQTGKSLALAECEAIGVDPMPMLKSDLGKNAKVIASTSDAFFASQADILLKKSVDLVFIDGMHLFEYALRDFINTEKYSNGKTLIVIDDIYPGHPAQASRERCTRAWTGDVWKIVEILKEYRPDLMIQTLDVYPTGLLLVTCLDSNSSILIDNYNDIVNKFMLISSPPERVNNRHGASPFSRSGLESFLNK